MIVGILEICGLSSLADPLTSRSHSMMDRVIASNRLRRMQALREPYNTVIPLYKKYPLDYPELRYPYLTPTVIPFYP